MGALIGSNNAVLVSKCQNLRNLRVTLQVRSDLITANNVGFSLQLNCYPQPTPKVNGQSLYWVQYVIAVGNNSVYWGIQYFSALKVPKGITGYGFNPSGNYGQNSQPPFASAPFNQVLAGSVMKIGLATDPSGNVASGTFSITDPEGNPSSYTFGSANVGLPLCALYGFEVNLVAYPSAPPVTFVRGTGKLTYAVSSGKLAVQTKNTCKIAVPTGSGTTKSPYKYTIVKTGGQQTGTAEQSNAAYGNVTPASGRTVSQRLSVIPWSSTDLNTSASALIKPRNDSPLDGYVTDYSNQQHVNYIGTDQHVHELWKA